VNIVFFAHPSFMDHQSMPRYARMLSEGMQQRGHQVAIWSPQPHLFKLRLSRGAKKWLSYIDQYLLFPWQVRRQLRQCPTNTLFVFTDHALGPWVPLVANRPHVIHCHDFLAQRSSLGEIPEHRTKWTGRQYQALIQHGYSKGKHFITTSENTKADLRRFLLTQPLSVNVIYNGLNQPFTPHNIEEARSIVGAEIRRPIDEGYLLHVGGNHWYKNRIGIIEIYNAWRLCTKKQLPLLLIGEAPSASLQEAYASSPYKEDIIILVGISDSIVRLAYAGATLFLFPSLAEGFGWPIAEAMASGCPVITTNEAPMTEVAGNAGFHISRRPFDKTEVAGWATESAKVVEKLVNLTAGELSSVVSASLTNAQRFDPEIAINAIERVYLTILNEHEAS
jgi:glycosyltransferase involved in cell wall biosynthesis